jgi:CubicO group peptidase (beta-lactamase class C family)
MATHALSQDLSGWSDKTVCRLVETNGGAVYVEEASSRGLVCKAPIKAKPTKPKSDSSTGIDRYGGRNPTEEASPNYETLKYFLYRYLYLMPGWAPRFHKVKGSNNPFNFQFDLQDDEYIKQQMQTTPLLSYLLYEDGKVVIDEITPKDRFGDMYTDSSLYHSRSMGKSITSYLTGHAICDGKIESVDSRLDDWPILGGTLYYNQKLIDLLNMSSGDSAYIKNQFFLNSDRDSNEESVQSIMKNEFKGSKKSYAKYHYTDTNPNLVLSYLLFKYGDADFKKLLDDVFMKKVRIGDGFIIGKQGNAKEYEKSLFAIVYTSRYDYLRIAKAMLDDWENDTCVGQYLKTIYDRRIKKGASWAASHDLTSRVGFPRSYGGFFHTGYKGMKNRPVMSMDGWGGQTITIDFERGRIIATLSIHDNMKFPKPGSFNWKKIVYDRIKYGKPASKLTTEVKQPLKAVIDSQQLLVDSEANEEVERLAKEYWDDYYEAIDEAAQGVLFGASADGSTMFSEDFEIEGQRDIRVGDRNNKWYIKQDNDGNSIYCNKVTNDWTHFNFGSEGWSNYSISYRMKFSTGKGGTTETHIRKTGDRDYRARISSYGGVEIQLKNSTIASGYVSTKTGEWLDIQLTASGDNIEYLVDGEVVASVIDDRLKKGSGFFAVSANAEVCIDDIVVNKM